MLVIRQEDDTHDNWFLNTPDTDKQSIDLFLAQKGIVHNFQEVKGESILFYSGVEEQFFKDAKLEYHAKYGVGPQYYRAIGEQAPNDEIYKTKWSI